LKPSPGIFFVASMPSLLPLAISLVAWSSTSDGSALGGMKMLRHGALWQ
jgi:NADH:ubiquinone oxidoreductase subunit H